MATHDFKQFPVEFGLRGFPGGRFAISERKSYMSGGEAIYVVLIWSKRRQEFIDFSKGSASELSRQIVKTNIGG